MKLLLDENLSRRLVPPLATHFPGTTQVALVGLEQIDDLRVWQYAKDQGYTLVTKDADFVDLSILHGAPPRIIWLKVGNLSNTDLLTFLLKKRLAMHTFLAVEDKTCLELY